LEIRCGENIAEFPANNSKGNKMAKLSGGGIESNKLVKPPVHKGGPNRGVNPGFVSQIGTAVDPKIIARTPEYKPALQTPAYGNAVALNVGKGGCGTGRTIYKTGTQEQHGPVAGTVRPAGKDILSEFGPDVPGRRR
jgi:hypothetical protein